MLLDLLRFFWLLCPTNYRGEMDMSSKTQMRKKASNKEIEKLDEMGEV